MGKKYSWVYKAKKTLNWNEIFCTKSKSTACLQYPQQTECNGKKEM